MTRGKHPLGDPAELAALYAAGAMDRGEAEAFEGHLAEGCAACAAEVKALDRATTFLIDGLPAPALPGSVRAALLERAAGSVASADRSQGAHPQIWREWDDDSRAKGLFTKRADEGTWDETGVEGVRVRRLFVDRSRNEMTMLVRMEAGAAYPRHVHDGPEQCLVLEGDLHVGDIVLHPGDYQRAAPGSLHGIQSTVGGCLLLITSSLSDEIA